MTRLASARLAATLALAALVAAVGCSPPSKEVSTVLLPVPGDPSVSFEVRFHAGSAYDPPGKEGLAYVTARLLAEGATTKRSYEQIVDALHPLAASYDASVDKEIVSFRGRTHGDNLDAYLELFVDALTAPAFDEADFRRVRDRTLSYVEKTLRYSSDEELGKAALAHAVFEGTPYRHPVVGTAAGLRGLTVDDVKSFYAKHYTPPNATLGLAGGLSDDLETRVREGLRGLPDGPAPQRIAPPSPPALERTEAILIDKPGADASISFGYPIEVRRGDEAFYPLWLANSWLGEHRNAASHLFQVIREKRGMNYGDYSYIEAFPQGGRRSMPPTGVARRAQLFEVWIRTLPDEQALFATRAALRAIDRLVTSGLPADEIELRREFLRKYSLHFAESASGRLGYALDDAFYGIDAPGHLERFRAEMEAMTPERVERAVREHLRSDRFVLAIVTGDAEGLRGALISGEPTPIAYATPKPNEILAEDEEIARWPLKLPPDAIRVVPVDEFLER